MTEAGREAWHRTMHLRKRGHKPRIRKVPCEVYSRIVGYLRPLKNWNVAKKQEFRDRKTYDVPERGDLVGGKTVDVPEV